MDGGPGSVAAARMSRLDAPLPLGLDCAAACSEEVQIALAVPSPHDQVSKVIDAPEFRFGSFICSCGLTVRPFVEIVDAAAMEEEEATLEDPERATGTFWLTEPFAFALSVAVRLIV